MKTTHIIIGLGIVAAGIVGILLYKRMKSKKDDGTTSTQPATNTTTSTTKPAGASTQPATNTTTSTTKPAGASTQPAAPTTTSASITKPVSTNTANIAGSSTIIGSLKDEKNGKMIITLGISEKDKYKVGDKVKVSSQYLKGTYPILYIYNRGTTAMNLYIDTPYIAGLASGIVTKV